MRNRLRSFDSKVTFFAFADIMFAVSGILIFVTLLLATDLGGTNGGQQTSASAELEREIEDALRQQVLTDNQNRHLQESIAAAETAPSVKKLQDDVAALRARLSDQQGKQRSVLNEAAGLSAATEKRDTILGLTGLKASIAKVDRVADDINNQEAKVVDEAKSVNQHLSSLESTLLQLRQREGQIWLIPDRSMTTKEPILVTVSGGRVSVERFDRPDQEVQFDANAADSGFTAYLRNSRPLDQYFVFLVRPSGIEVFKGLLSDARATDFEVGYDAIEEGRPIHFSTFPPLTNEPSPSAQPPSSNPETTPQETSQSPDAASASPPPSPPSAAGKSSPRAAAVPSTTSNPAPKQPVAMPQKEKSWWQRLLEWIGISR
jgi:hypothetical protein